MRNKSKTWFITGCDSGMGYAVAKFVLEQGDRVIVTARDIRNVRSLLDAHPQTAYGFDLDVTNFMAIAKVVDDAIGITGGVDVLLNNAGYGVIGAAEETCAEEYRPMFEVNFFGLAEVTKAVLPHMRAQGGGYVFNTSSLGGFAASPAFSFYAASKFAVEGFSEALAQEVAPLGIKVVIVEPGSFRTNFAGASLRKTRDHIRVYQETSVKTTLDRMEMRDGAQPNDPKKLAHVLYQLTRLEKVPLRLPLGEDALLRVRNKISACAAEFEAWEEIIRSVAFDKSSTRV